MAQINTGTTAFWSDEYMDAVLENFHDGIYITDCEANTVYLNHSYELISGLLRSEMLGKNMRELVREGVISMSGTLNVLSTHETVTIEQSFNTGKRAIITSRPVFKEETDQIIMVVTIVREITEIYSIRKELQQQRFLNRELSHTIERLNNKINGTEEIIAVDEASVKLLRLLDRVSMLDTPVLLYGETGAGKERMARYIHDHSARSRFPFMRIDLSVLPEIDPVRYFFGYEDNTGNEYHMGMLESAGGGTVYIEDILDLPQTVYGHFLSLLRDGSCVMGDGMMRRLNVRLIAGSHLSSKKLRQTKLHQGIVQGFSVFSMEVKPLSERREDVVPLLKYFLNQHYQMTRERKKFSPACYEKLLSYDWPGNVRELENMVQRACIISEGDTIHPEDMTLRVQSGHIERSYPGRVDIKMEVARFEAGYMTRAFYQYKNIRSAAESLGMDSSTYVRKRQKYEQMGLMRKLTKKTLETEN